MSNSTCETCRWWRKFTEFTGRCHRYPPVPMPQSTQSSGIQCEIQFPSTDCDDWCGEHSPLPENPQ